MFRRVIVVGVAAGAAGVILYATLASPAGPTILRPPRVVVTPWPSEDIEVDSTPRDWRAAGDARVSLSYSWLRCDLEGKRCRPLPRLHTRRIVPPQQLRIVTVRAVVIAKSGGGSTSVVSSNFSFDEAGRGRTSRTDLYPLVYDPKQLRHWYGLRPGQNGHGETIVITALWRSPGLAHAVDQFSLRYGLPRSCDEPGAGSPCFEFVDNTVGRTAPLGTNEDEDVEWAHAIAPMARIVVVRSRSLWDLAGRILSERENDDATVFSASWGYHGKPDRRFERGMFFAIRVACDASHVVCTFPSGDSGPPGDRPSNSPDVLAVGGTAFTPRRDGSLRAEEPWLDGGYGVTRFPLPMPSWQRGVCPARPSRCVHRTVPDVSATAGSVAQYEVPPGTPGKHPAGWFRGGGTSLSSPLWAALIADADAELSDNNQQPMGIDELHAVLYRGWVSAGLDDLGHHGWSARIGWGAPKAGIVDVLVKAIERYRARR